MRILFAVNIPFPEGGANTRHISTIAREMVNQGEQVSLIIPFARKSVPKSQIIDGIEIIWCYVPKSAESILSSNGRVRFHVQVISRIRFTLKFIILSLQNRYDWVYLYQPFPDATLAAFIARITGNRVYSEFVDKLNPEDWPEFGGKVIYLSLAFADVLAARLSSVICVISSILEHRYRRIAPHAKIIRVPTIIDTKLFKPRDASQFQCTQKAPDSKWIVYTGSLTKYQGVANLIEAMSIVVQEHEHVHLMIAGGSHAIDRDDVPALISTFGLSEKVTYLGMLPLKEVIDLQTSADILVAPKLDHPVNHAGFSQKLAEYLSTGKPVVVSRVGDVPLYLQHGVHAMLCEPGNIRDLTANISLLLSDEVLAAQIGKQGRVLAKEVFDISKNVANIIEILGKSS